MVFLWPVIIQHHQALQDISLHCFDYMRAEAANYKTDNRGVDESLVPAPHPWMKTIRSGKSMAFSTGRNAIVAPKRHCRLMFPRNRLTRVTLSRSGHCAEGKFP